MVDGENLIKDIRPSMTSSQAPLNTRLKATLPLNHILPLITTQAWEGVAMIELEMIILGREVVKIVVGVKTEGGQVKVEEEVNTEEEIKTEGGVTVGIKEGITVSMILEDHLR